MTKEYFRIEIMETQEVIECLPGETILLAVRKLGKKGIPLGCSGGGCGVCKIQIHAGRYETGKMSRAHISLEDLGKGIVLACKTKPLSNLRIAVLGKVKNNVLGDTHS